MKNICTLLITFAGLSVAPQLSMAMEIDQGIDISPDQPTVSPSGRIYNLRPSRGTTSFEWIKSQEDPNRTFPYMSAELPRKYDFRKDIPYIHDQGRLGSCTAQAITLSMEYILKTTTPEAYRPLSPLFVYYNERAIEGSIPYDAGAVIADGIISICRQGACSESKWTYSDNRVKFKKKPPQIAYKDARQFVDLDNIGDSHVPQDLTTLKTILAQGIPIVFGIDVFSSFESPIVERTGKVPMPKPREKKLGGHAMTLVGYNDNKKVFYFANSWGESWGKKGFGSIPYDYILNPKLTDPDDFWKIESVGPKAKKSLSMDINTPLQPSLATPMEIDEG